MVDIVSPAARSRMMARIRAKNTKPEVLVRKALFAAGYRFRLHRKDLPGSPDIVLPGRNVAILVHGCFWHMHAGCKNAKLPSSRSDFWRMKLQGNVARDKAAADALRELGWRVLVVWECGTRDPTIASELSQRLSSWIESDEPVGEISAV
ncbi:very short patch repair endonuclease [Ralstonia solanacearum]|uniref:Very short patch repair endonuclease n=1 Tax=Ralstonia solanacearum TaxID=305 RepID=A0AAD0S907_RALSL|nr:DNA mismatch endonuclease Vsr [Ralstonia solanacearum]AXV83023.1 very short patch repair endonuclease [Ralstonia solanacearum]AXW54139.1 very short patch repair endonuclease [Ralstonia solanacearum]